MKINTGQGTVPLIIMLAIWSVSAIISLPGLAVSPILGELDVIFPKSTELQEQMLTSMPSLLIIPFILLSGKFAEKHDKTKLLLTGLTIFLLSGVLYLFAKSMIHLILISCLLGIGAGIIIPLSTGLISDFFVGSYKTKQLGIVSAVSNLSLVIATALTGKLALINWHYPFIVYLFPIVTVFFSYFLSNKRLSKMNIVSTKDDSENPKDVSSILEPGMKIHKANLSQLMLVYFVATYIVLVITFNLPFLIQKFQLTSSESGYMISLFFLAIMLPGFFINQIIGLLKNYTVASAFVLIATGLLLTIASKIGWVMGIGVIFTGLGYGIIQPMVYDKATLTSVHAKKVLVLGFVMSMNYLAILLSPFITDILGKIFDFKDDTYPFHINLVLALIIAIIAFIRHKSFVFSAKTGY